MRAVVVMIATILGLGILGLPYVFTQAGFVVGLVELLVVAAALCCLYLMYAEITLHVPGRHRYAGYMGQLLGPRVGRFAGIFFVATMFGGLLPFLIVVGPFLHGLFGLDPFFGSILMWMLAAVMLLFGMGVVVRVESWIIGTLLLVYVLLMIFSVPHLHLNAMAAFGKPHFFLLPIGVILFALGGFGAIPEMHDLLGRQKRRIGKAILLSMTILTLLYGLFVFFVMGTLGETVAQNPLPAMAALMPPWLGVLVLLVGTISAFSIFPVIGSELIATLQVDFGRSKGFAWSVTALVPLLVYLAGVRELTTVMGFFGSTFGAVIGLFIIAAYGKTKAPRLLPLWSRYPVALVFALGALAEIWYTLSV